MPKGTELDVNIGPEQAFDNFDCQKRSGGTYTSVSDLKELFHALRRDCFKIQLDVLSRRFSQCLGARI